QPFEAPPPTRQSLSIGTKAGTRKGGRAFHKLWGGYESDRMSRIQARCGKAAHSNDHSRKSRKQ
ncbi:MAG: hypothetical protein AB1487_00730, partial [Thermodesulfobacteriota bacterium]